MIPSLPIRCVLVAAAAVSGTIARAQGAGSVAGTGASPASAGCDELAAQSADLKARMRQRIGDRAPSVAQSQVAGQAAAGTVALAGQAAAQFVGVVGVAISQGAIEAGRMHAKSGIATARSMMDEGTALSRQIQAIEAEREKRCSGRAAE